jgi:aldehyde dehydrogenase (NAD+)
MNTLDDIKKISGTAFIGDDSFQCKGREYHSFSPIDNSLIYSFNEPDQSILEEVIERSKLAFECWRLVPAPKRGELIRIFAEILRENKSALANCITLEVGKIPTEAQGEVQEMIDICDYAVGLSRQLYGLTMPSERPGHRLMEQWHPLGPTLVISAFNFPAAVWAWNACLALVCGNSIIWKPSEKAPLTAVYTHQLFQKAYKRSGLNAGDICSVVLGGKSIGEYLVKNKNVSLVSATGSTEMGRDIGQVVAKRFGRTILELGGNNACIITPSANLDMARRSILFSAVGTAGQRCTTMRRLIVHKDLKDNLISQLVKSYKSLRIGNPMLDGVLVGPLIDNDAVEAFENALNLARSEGGIVHCGEKIEGNYVRPAIVEISAQSKIAFKETFAPILYIMTYSSIEEAIEINNSVSQGLSSSIFSNDMREIELFLSACGSDCGIANVNMGGSGAEIGGAFGGEKETGGGRECGSDSWKAYMRRLTSAINYSNDLPLAQGVVFED